MKVSFEWELNTLDCRTCPCAHFTQDDSIICGITSRDVDHYVVSDDPRVNHVDYMCPLTRETNEEIFYDDGK